MRRAGFTLLELSISIAVLLIVMGGAFTVAFRAQIGFGLEAKHFTLEQAGRRILERLSEEIR